MRIFAHLLPFAVLSAVALAAPITNGADTHVATAGKQNQLHTTKHANAADKASASDKQSGASDKGASDKDAGETGGSSKGSISFPFNHIVAFGDNLSDNGNGSAAHGVAQEGDPHNKIYGDGTWTNGPVAISYLANDLNMPLTDYAYGHADGGSKFGATVDNSYTLSTADAPSSKDQIANYTGSSKVETASSALHFLWIGNNDINLYHIGTAEGSDNSQFAEQMSSRIVAQVQSLLDVHAAAVFVPGLYPKQISPSKEFYAQTSAQQETLGKAIEAANSKLQEELSKLGDKVIYYDVYGKMLSLWNNHDSVGIQKVGDTFCDGHSQADWDQCVKEDKGDEYYWMQYTDPTTKVHELVGNDMFAALKSHYGLS